MIPALLAAMIVSPMPAPFTEAEVQFTGVGGLQLFGTLTSPPSNFTGKRPGVLLLPGSGPTDRDGNALLLGVRTDLHKQIAAALAALGIASLRFDKRAIMRYSEHWPKSAAALSDYFCLENFVGDAAAAYRYLRTRSNVDPARVAISGHSEGGLLALQIGYDLRNSAEEPPCLVLLATAGRPLGPVIHEQITRGVASLPPDKAKSLIDYSDLACASLARNQPLPPNTPSELAALFNPSALRLMGSYCRIDPFNYAAAYKGNVLIINGTSDTQVSPVRDAPRLKQAFGTRPKGHVEMRLIANASHNFKSTSSGDPNAFEGPAQPEMLVAVSNFLKRELRP